MTQGHCNAGKGNGGENGDHKDQETTKVSTIQRVVRLRRKLEDQSVLRPYSGPQLKTELEGYQN